VRRELTGQGLDAGPHTITWHLAEHHQLQVSVASIWRTVKRAGLVTPEPKKKTKAAYVRFEAEQPNEMWQTDFTHYRLSSHDHICGGDVEILTFLDHHSRYALSVTCYRRITGPAVVAAFQKAGADQGIPVSVLSDNGSVYTSRFTGGRNGFEYLLASPRHHPEERPSRPSQTQGKIERFQQTLKRWLAAQPAAATLTELQTQLDTFADIYNQTRPHRALPGVTPAQVYSATIKAAPTDRGAKPHYRVRNDHVDRLGKISLRRAGRMHHLGVGAAHKGQVVTILIDADTVTVIHQDTGEVLSKHTIDADRIYWRNQHKPPGRWPHQYEQ
jgi:transposase InsO family protein